MTNIWHETIGAIFASNPNRMQSVDAVGDLAIELLAAAGCDPNDRDEVGDEVSDAVQTHLMCAMMRSSQLAGLLSAWTEDHYQRQSRTLRVEAVHMDAFNLFVGAAFRLSSEVPDVWVVMEFEDNADDERVTVFVRRADLDTDTPPVAYLTFHYCDKVQLIGNVRNAKDLDDNNWGQN